MASSHCPCCSDTLLRHIRSGEIYWFCGRCHQEMPNLVEIANKSQSRLALNTYSYRHLIAKLELAI